MHSLQAEQPETKEPILEIAKPLTRNWQFEGKQFYLDIRYTDTRSMSCKRCRFTIYSLHHHPPIILYMAHCSRFSAILEVCQFIWFFIHPLGTQLSPTLNSSWIKRHRINKYRKIETHRIASTSDKQRRSSGKRIAKAAESSRAQTEVPAEPKVSWSIDQVITKECCLARLYISLEFQAKEMVIENLLLCSFYPLLVEWRIHCIHLYNIVYNTKNTEKIANFLFLVGLLKYLFIRIPTILFSNIFWSIL